MKKVTLKDIADDLNVTVGTVSHVFNGIDDISEATKARVWEAANRLGYIPNGAAASLRSKRTKTIAVIGADITNPLISRQIHLIEEQLKALDLGTLIFFSNEKEEEEFKAIMIACVQRVDGILLCPTEHGRKHVQFLERQEVPYVLVGRRFPDIDSDYVCADDHKSGMLIGEYLSEHGWTSPVYFGAKNCFEFSDLRFQGMADAFSEKGITIGDERFIHVNPTMDNWKSAVDDLLASDMKFDCIFASFDTLAFRIMSYLKERGYERIPVVGVDALQKHLCLPFSHVSVEMVDRGWAEEACSALLAKINGSTERCQKRIDVRLVESTFPS